MSNYSVGYRKPPMNTRFEKGRSGNPKGRPKGSNSMSNTLTTVLNEKVTIREGDKVLRISRFEAMMRSLTLSAMKGNPRACATIFSLAREYGHVEQGHAKTTRFTLSIFDSNGIEVKKPPDQIPKI